MTCKEEKDSTQFGSNAKELDGLNRKCKGCYNLYMREYYSKKKDTHISRVQTAKQRRIALHRAKLWEYFSINPCISCGESNPKVLELDHLNPKQKTRGVAKMISRNFAWEKIVDEIAKCQVLCLNCHRKRTIDQFDWWQKVQFPDGVQKTPKT